MVCVECYLPFLAVLAHFVFPYVAALVKRCTGRSITYTPAVCPVAAPKAARAPTKTAAAEPAKAAPAEPAKAAACCAPGEGGAACCAEAEDASCCKPDSSAEREATDPVAPVASS